MEGPAAFVARGGNWRKSLVQEEDGDGCSDGQSRVGEVGAPGLCPAPTSSVSWPGRWANSSSVPRVCFVPLLAPLIYTDHQYDNYIHLQI